jgi:hypothetical protein
LKEDFGCEPELRRTIGKLVNFFYLLSGESRHPNFTQKGMKDWEYFLDGDCRDVVLVVLAARLLFEELEEALMELCNRVSGVSICHCILSIWLRCQKRGATRSGMSDTRHEKPTCWGDEDEKDVQGLFLIAYYWFYRVGSGGNGWVVALGWFCRREARPDGRKVVKERVVVVYFGFDSSFGKVVVGGEHAVWSGRNR